MNIQEMMKGTRRKRGRPKKITPEEVSQFQHDQEQKIIKNIRKQLRKKDKLFIKSLNAEGGPTDPLTWYNKEYLLSEKTPQVTPLFAQMYKKIKDIKSTVDDVETEEDEEDNKT
jgi:hypothetical protein